MFFRLISVKLSLCLIAGIILGKLFAIPLILGSTFTFLFLMALLWTHIKRQNTGPPLFGILAAFTTVGIGICSMSLSDPQNQWDHYTRYPVSGPQLHHLKIREILPPNSYSDRYVATVLQLAYKNVKGKILLTVSSDSTAGKLRVDDELLVYGTMENLSKNLNPHQFDYASYLGNNGIYHQMRVSPDAFIPAREAPGTVYGAAAALREKIIGALQKGGFGREQLGIIQALLLGDRSDIPEEVNTHYKNAGAVHILAVSGLHIGILLLLLHFILGPLETIPYGKNIKLGIIALLLWAFAFLAGLSPSVVRAVTMFSFLAYAMFLNRPTNTYNILALSLFFTLLVAPNWLFQAGFQMSYAAVFAIIWIYPLLQRIWTPKWYPLKKGWQLMAVGIAAQMGVFPIALYYFHQFPALFFISNLAIVPFLGIVLGVGILVILLALCNALPFFLASFYNGTIGAMNGIIGWIGRQEDFVFQQIPFDSVQVVLAYATVVGTAFLLEKRTVKRWQVFLGTVILFQGYLLFATYTHGKKEGALVLHQTRNTVLFHRKGPHLNVWATHTAPLERIKNDFTIGERIRSISYAPLQPMYHLGPERLYIFDSLAMYPPPDHRPEHILLTQSPKINLQRLIDSLRPKLIIADGSNYRSDVIRWERTCAQNTVPFHYTGKEGAYWFDLPK